MNARDDLLRAHVFAALDARGSERYGEALWALHDGYLLWPSVEYQHALERAREAVHEAEQAELDWYYAIPTIGPVTR